MRALTMCLATLATCAVNSTFAGAIAFANDNASETRAKEEHCANHVDDDKDSVMDCADADCFADPACKSGGGLENSDALCSDFVDNDGDEHTDCDDVDCHGPGVRTCRGSWEGPIEGSGGGHGATEVTDIPEISEGMDVENLLGKGSDKDGERNDEVCSDGIDNDNDGKTDCADLGCRFDPEVTACHGAPGLRFSVLAHAAQIYDVDADRWDTQFRILQLRAFGPVPYIQDSFFLLSMRAERTPRVTFAMFEMPIVGRHRFTLSSGGATLSTGPILSIRKNPMIDRPYYLYEAFDGGNGAGIEFKGPLVRGLIDYRLIAGGGTGRFSGSVGGQFVDNYAAADNFTFGVGAQFALFALGHFDSLDTRYLYTEVARALTFELGAKREQRQTEQYEAMNFQARWRWWRTLVTLEAYGKREHELGSWQFSGNAMASFLIWPKRLLFAADIGGFRASDFENPPAQLTNDLRRLADEIEWRLALHAYVWKNAGLLSLLYIDDWVEDSTHKRELRLEAQVRF